MQSVNATGPEPGSRRGGLERIALGPARLHSALGKRAALIAKLVPSIFPILALAFAVIFFRSASAGGYGTNYIYPLIMMGAVAVFGVACLVATWIPKRVKSVDEISSARGNSAPGSGMASVAARPAVVEAVIGTGVTATTTTTAGSGEPADRQRAGNGRDNWLRSVAVIVWLIIYVAIIPLFGMIVGGGIFTFGLMLSLGYRKPIRVAAIAIVLSVVVWLVFVHIFGVALPGIWG